MIREHDRVVLKVALSNHSLEPGDVGVVVHIYPRQVSYEVEFITPAGADRRDRHFFSQPNEADRYPTRVNWRTDRIDL
jgi:hypothetical protein